MKVNNNTSPLVGYSFLPSTNSPKGYYIIPMLIIIPPKGSESNPSQLHFHIQNKIAVVIYRWPTKEFQSCNMLLQSLEPSKL